MIRILEDKHLQESRSHRYRPSALLAAIMMLTKIIGGEGSLQEGRRTSAAQNRD